MYPQIPRIPFLELHFVHFYLIHLNTSSIKKIPFKFVVTVIETIFILVSFTLFSHRGFATERKKQKQKTCTKRPEPVKKFLLFHIPILDWCFTIIELWYVELKLLKQFFCFCTNIVLHKKWYLCSSLADWSEHKFKTDLNSKIHKFKNIWNVSIRQGPVLSSLFTLYMLPTWLCLYHLYASDPQIFL